MTFGLALFNQVGVQIEATNMLSVCTSVTTVPVGTGSYTVPASTYIVAIPAATGIPLVVSLSSPTTVSYSPSSYGSSTSIIFTFL